MVTVKLDPIAAAFVPASKPFLMPPPPNEGCNGLNARAWIEGPRRLADKKRDPTVYDGYETLRKTDPSTGPDWRKISQNIIYKECPFAMVPKQLSFGIDYNRKIVMLGDSGKKMQPTLRENDVFPFMELPGEIRNIIYGYLFASSHPFHGRLIELEYEKRRAKPTKRPLWPYNPKKPMVTTDLYLARNRVIDFEQFNYRSMRMVEYECVVGSLFGPMLRKVSPGRHMALLRSCRQVYQEASEIVYERNEFVVIHRAGPVEGTAPNHVEKWTIPASWNLAKIRNLTVEVHLRGSEAVNYNPREFADDEARPSYCDLSFLSCMPQLKNLRIFLTFAWDRGHHWASFFNGQWRHVYEHRKLFHNIMTAVPDKEDLKLELGAPPGVDDMGPKESTGVVHRGVLKRMLSMYRSGSLLDMEGITPIPDFCLPHSLHTYSRIYNYGIDGDCEEECKIDWVDAKVWSEPV